METDPHRLSPPPQPSACELCGRPVTELTKHHLIPRAWHHKRAVQKRFDRQTMHTRILWVCRPCHNFIHYLKSERELALDYPSREQLLEIPELREFVDWLSSKPAGFTPKRLPRKR